MTETKLDIVDSPKYEFTTEAGPDDLAGVRVGQWYWVKRAKDDREYKTPFDNDGRFSFYQALKLDKSRIDADGRWLGCVVKIGSNYIALESARFETRNNISQYSCRVHVDSFFDRCEFESNPVAIIKTRIAERKQVVGELMSEVKRLTAALGVAPRTALQEQQDETQALAVRGDTDYNEYKSSLVKAKEETLPNIFSEMNFHHSVMVGWMKAELIPAKAEAGDMEAVIDSVDDRIFSVELYAGLIETIWQISDGEPAHNDEKLHLMQRRCYMDEECLARYRTGGMEFHDIGEFDEWLAEPENRDRIFPFPRCMVAFRVRRNDKERVNVDMSNFIHFEDMNEANKKTFLYIRNGERLYCLGTELDFGEKLFPDLDRGILGSGQTIWAQKDWREWRLITNDQYEGAIEDYEIARKLWRKKYKAWKAERKAWKGKSKEYRKAHKSESPSPFEPSGRPEDPRTKWIQFNQDTVFYDDIAEAIQADIKTYNRIALIIQGLFDRSDTLVPHPPYQIWTPEGFDSAIVLHYDDSRAIAPADMPDFEEYRARLNASLTKGCVTVGQELYWEKEEARKECERRDNDYNDRGFYRPDRYRPYGNGGPGYLATVTSISRKKKTCSFKWFKKRQRAVAGERWGDGPDVQDRIAVPFSELFNCDAYEPGDFKRFFDDPRTRANYIQWAPMLLAAEEYKAGKMKPGMSGPKDYE